MDWDGLKPHTDEDQVQLDVHRSFVYYPKGEWKQCRRVHTMMNADR